MIVSEPGEMWQIYKQPSSNYLYLASYKSMTNFGASGSSIKKPTRKRVGFHFERIGIRQRLEIEPRPDLKLARRGRRGEAERLRRGQALNAVRVRVRDRRNADDVVYADEVCMVEQVERLERQFKILGFGKGESSG